MRLFDQLLGAKREPGDELVWWVGPARPRARDCYRYLVRTAPPLAIERAHAEAFGRLSPDQLRQIAGTLRPAQPSAAADALDTRKLAQWATRVELRKPGMLERELDADDAAREAPPSLFDIVASAFVSTAIAQQFLGGIDHEGRVTEPLVDAASEFDYEEADYETAPFETFVDRNGVDL
jgi:hypothetical protein